MQAIVLYLSMNVQQLDCKQIKEEGATMKHSFIIPLSIYNTLPS